MKKLITILLTSLMLITTLSVNILAEGDENMPSGDELEAVIIFDGFEIPMYQHADTNIYKPLFTDEQWSNGFANKYYDEAANNGMKNISLSVKYPGATDFENIPIYVGNVQVPYFNEGETAYLKRRCHIAKLLVDEVETTFILNQITDVIECNDVSQISKIWLNSREVEVRFLFDESLSNPADRVSVFVIKVPEGLTPGDVDLDIGKNPLHITINDGENEITYLNDSASVYRRSVRPDMDVEAFELHFEDVNGNDNVCLLAFNFFNGGSGEGPGPEGDIYFPEYANMVKEYDGTGNLQELINELRPSYNAKIVLTNDITLQESIKLEHHDLGGSPNEFDKFNYLTMDCLTIDLNGHNINCGNYNMTVPSYSNVHIINSKYTSDNAVPNTITSTSPAFTIRNSGTSLGLYEGVVVSNPNGTAIEVTENSHETVIGKNAAIQNSKFGIRFTSANRVDSGWSRLRVHGDIVVENRAIEAMLGESTTPVHLDIRGDEATHQSINISANEGIVTNANVELMMMQTNLTATRPFIVSGGTYDFRHSDVITQTENGTPISEPIFFINRDFDNAASSLDITINAGQGNILETTSYLVSQIGDTYTKPTMIQIYTNNYVQPEYHFGFGSNGLFDSSIMSDSQIQKIIFGGNFVNNFVGDSSQTAEQKFENYMNQFGSYTYEPFPESNVVRVRNNNTQVTVTNVNQLENALNNPATSVIFIGEDFDCGCRRIPFNNDFEKNIEFRGHTITNVTLEARTSKPATNQAQLNLNNGKIVNNCEQSDSHNHPILIVNGPTVNVRWGYDADGETRVEWLGFESTGTVVEVRSGTFRSEGTSYTMIGSNTAVIDTSDKATVHISDVNIINNAGKVVDIRRSSDPATNVTLGNYGRGMNTTITQKDNQPIVNTNGNAGIYFEGVKVEGGNYGVLMSENASADITIRDCEMTLGSAFDLGPKANRVVVDHSTIDASNDTFVLCRPTRLVIANGNYSCGDRGAIVSYKSDTGRSGGDIYGGSYSKMVREDALTEGYYCIQFDSLTAKYPYRVVRKVDSMSGDGYSFNAYVSIDQDLSVGVDNLSNSISEEEKEKDSTNKDVIFVAERETDNIAKKNIQAFISSGLNPEIVEYLDMYVKKREEKENGSYDINNLSETHEYQRIDIKIEDNKVAQALNLEGIFIVHRHSNKEYLIPRGIGNTIPDVGSVKEECFYVDTKNDGHYLVLFTRKYSTFAYGFYSEHTEHNYVTVEALAPTCEDAGYNEHKMCQECGETLGKELIPPTHSYDEKWSFDEKQHWHVANCGHNDQTTTKEDHTWNKGVVTTPATHLAEGEMTYTCEVCGGTKTANIEKISEHNYETTLSSDADNHWYAASCGHDAKKDVQPHTWGAGVVTTAPTCTTEGVMTYTCSVCSKTKTEVIPVTDEHTFKTTLSSDDTFHWYDTTCGHDVQKDVRVHVWNDGEVTTAPTCTTEGVMTYTCSVCSKTKTEVIPVTDEHTFNQQLVTEDYLASAADCENAAKYYKTCLCGKAGEETFEFGEAKGHDVVQIEGHFEGEDIVATHYECNVCDKKSLNKDMTDPMSKDEFIVTVDTLKEYLSSVANGTDSATASAEMDYVSSLIPADVFSRIIANEMVNESDTPLVEILEKVEAVTNSNGSLKVEIDEKVIAKEDIQVIGVGLNSNDSLLLKIDDCEDDEAVEEYLESRSDLDIEKSFGFSVTLIKKSSGEEITELSVPITVTIKVPEGLDSSKIVLLHNHNGGYKQIGFSVIMIDDEEYIRFTVSGLSDFLIVERIITPSTPGSGTSGYKAPKTGIR